MITSEVEPALQWTCPSCGLQWVERGSGFPGTRFSECLRCGGHALEEADAKPTLRQPPAVLPRSRRLIARH